MNGMLEKTNAVQGTAITRQKNIRTKRKTAFSILKTVGILFARAMPIVGTAPFGISFLSVERRFSIGAVLNAVMVAIGYASLLDFEIAVKYICISAAYLIFLSAASEDDCDISRITAAAVTGAITALGNLGMMIWNGFSFGGSVLLVCDTALAMLGVFVFDKLRGIFRGKRGSLLSMNFEEKVCFCIMAAIVLFGLKSIRVQDIFSASGSIGLWCISVVALSGGLGASAVCGIAAGVILGADGDLLTSAAQVSLCALAGGIASRYGKLAVAFSVAAAAVALFFGGVADMPFGYIDIPFAVAAVISTPDSMIRIIGRIIGKDSGADRGNRAREYAISRLDTAANSFRTLSETFFDISDKHNTVDMEDVSMMFDGVADKVCRECSKMSECWVSGFNSTYKSMFRMLEVAERRGEISESDADEYFSRKCLRLRAVVKEMNRLFEIYKINCVWKSKLYENRELAGEQLGSVALILDELSRELCEETPDSGAEEEVRSRLAAKGIDIHRIDITLNPKGRHTAHIEFVSGETDFLRRIAETTLKSVLGVKLVLNGATESGGRIMMRFACPEGFYIESGSASIGKNEECGDNCITRALSGGKYAAAISDGMGTGHRAARDSGATVRLLGDFLEAGFDKSIAVRLVNSIMVMKSADEAFATVDMCVIDLYSGEAEFIKNGAEPSYIKRETVTETVRAATLPVGVVQNMEIESFAHKLGDGDIIVMTSDGLQMKKGHENWIKSMVEEADSNMPSQELADRILGMAMTLRGGECDDDMTVVVLKMVKL